MPSYKLIPEGGSSKSPWLLEWDRERFVVRDATGLSMLDTEIATAHEVVDLSQTFVDGTICIAAPSGALRFKRNSAAEAKLRRLVEAAIARDPAYRASMRQRSLRAMTLGPILFLVAGGLFGGYCWYAIGAPDPPAGHWIRYLSWLIKGLLLILLAIALLGLGLSFSGFSQWMRIRRIEREVNTADIEPS